MKPNDPLIDPAGNPARLITMPIPGRTPALAVLLYPNGRGLLVDLAACRPLPQPQQNPPRSNKQ